MKELTGDIWDYYKQGRWVVITTNGTIKTDGTAVMGRGVALQAKQGIWDLPSMLGNCIKVRGNRLHTFLTLKLIAFPVKHHWKSLADLELIEASAKELVEFVDKESIEEIYMVRPGCGSGRLNWKEVKSVLKKYLDDRFVVVQR